MSQFDGLLPFASLDIVTLACQMLLTLGRFDRIAAILDYLIPIREQAGALQEIPDLYYFKGHVLLNADERSEAQMMLERAQAASVKMGERRMRWKILFALASMEVRKGKSERLRQEAYDEIAFIADNIGEADLRDAFLNRRDVRQLIDKAK